MSEIIHKSYNVSKLVYHFVFPAKYRKVVIDDEADQVIKETCVETGKRHELNIMEVGTDKDHVHFPAQSTTPLQSTMHLRCMGIKLATLQSRMCPLGTLVC